MPSVVDPSLNVTVPVGVGVPEAGETVAVKVTLEPTAMEAADEERVVVVAVGTGAVPVPVRLTIWGLSVALSVKVSIADSAACVAGVNVTLTVQVFPAATIAPLHVLEPTVKSARSLPFSTTLLMVKDVAPVLVIVSVLGLLVVPWV